MRLIRTFTPLVAIVCIAAALPAPSSARPITDRVLVKPHGRCYQLNPITPGQPRGLHRVLCGNSGALLPADLDEPTVSALHSQASGEGVPWDTIALVVAALALVLSAAAATSGRRRVRSRRAGASRTLMTNPEGRQ
jgi:hypothetical protein